MKTFKVYFRCKGKMDSAYVDASSGEEAGILVARRIFGAIIDRAVLVKEVV